MSAHAVVQADDFHIAILAGVPVDYTDGTPPATGEGVYSKGSLVIDTTNGNVYMNTGTKAQPVYSKMAKFSDIV